MIRSDETPETQPPPARPDDRTVLDREHVFAAGTAIDGRRNRSKRHRILP